MVWSTMVVSTGVGDDKSGSLLLGLEGLLGTMESNWALICWVIFSCWSASKTSSLRLGLVVVHCPTMMMMMMIERFCFRSSSANLRLFFSFFFFNELFLIYIKDDKSVACGRSRNYGPSETTCFISVCTNCVIVTLTKVCFTLLLFFLFLFFYFWGFKKNIKYFNCKIHESTEFGKRENKMGRKKKTRWKRCRIKRKVPLYL